MVQCFLVAVCDTLTVERLARLLKVDVVVVSCLGFRVTNIAATKHASVPHQSSLGACSPSVRVISEIDAEALAATPYGIGGGGRGSDDEKGGNVEVLHLVEWFSRI